jgi:hypothetical protein
VALSGSVNVQNIHINLGAKIRLLIYLLSLNSTALSRGQRGCAGYQALPGAEHLRRGRDPFGHQPPGPRRNLRNSFCVQAGWLREPN